VGDSIVTADTAEDADEARVELDCALMTDANVGPFCKRLIFVLAGVLGLKKACQFALIAETAAEELPPEDGAADADAADAGALAGALEPGELEPGELELLLQAAMVAASATPSAGMRKTC
jgi:hypothetical protein